MILFDFKTEDICALLNVSDSFVSQWKIRFENEGASALKLNYKGGTGLLTEDQRDEIIFYLRMQPHYSAPDYPQLPTCCNIYIFDDETKMGWVAEELGVWSWATRGGPDG